MPRGNQMPEEDQLVKLLLIGASKSGKTHYCMEAAKAGFNVLYLDGDVSRPTIMSFFPETLSRVWYMNLCDTQRIPRQWQLTEKLFKSSGYLWDDTNQQSLNPANAVEVAIWKISLGLLTWRDVLVIDSWSSLVASIKKYIAKQGGFDLAKLGDSDTRSLYSAGNYMCDFILGCIQAAPCHVIVTAHPGEYEHKVKPKGVISNIREKDMEIKSVRSIPASLSNPHGSKMGKNFTDVAWLSPDVTGRKRIIDGRPNAERESGGRFNGIKATSEFSFKHLVALAHGRVPETPDEWKNQPLGGIEEFLPGEYKTPSGGATEAKGVLKNRGGSIGTKAS